MQYEIDLASEHKNLFLEIRQVLLSFPDIVETKKPRITTYSNQHGGICHLRTMAHGCDIGFLKGARMADKFELLSGSGKAIRVYSMAELKKGPLHYYMQQALELNSKK